MKAPAIPSPPLRSILKKSPPSPGGRAPSPAAGRGEAAAPESSGSGEPDSVHLRVLKYIVFPLLVAVFSIWLYRSTFQAGFVWDDRAAIVRFSRTRVPTACNDSARIYSQVGNKDVHGWSTSMWRHDFWGADLTLGDSHKSYRPVTVLTYRYTKSSHTPCDAPLCIFCLTGLIILYMGCRVGDITSATCWCMPVW